MEDGLALSPSLASHQEPNEAVHLRTLDLRVRTSFPPLQTVPLTIGTRTVHSFYTHAFRFLASTYFSSFCFCARCPLVRWFRGRHRPQHCIRSCKPMGSRRDVRFQLRYPARRALGARWDVALRDLRSDPGRYAALNHVQVHGHYDRRSQHPAPLSLHGFHKPCGAGVRTRRGGSTGILI